ncbi:MAG: hypothetical protein ACO3A2_09900 [Bdellovibrionia bacterium]
MSSSLEGASATIQIDGAEADIQAAGLTPSFSGQFRLFDRIGIEFGVDFSEILGSDEYSALILGANLSYHLSAAFRFSVVREKHWILTPIIEIGTQQGKNFSPLNAVAETITTKSEAVEKKFLSSSSSTPARIGLLAAMSIKPSFGFLGEISRTFAKTTSNEGTTDDGFYRVGIALNTNLIPALNVPIGMTAGYRNDFPTRSGSEPTPMIAIGVFEMLNSDFNFGIEFTRLITSKPNLSAALSLSYYY